MDKIIFKNNAEVDLQAGGSLGALQVLSVNKAAMIATWEQMTSDNLSEVKIKNEAGLIVGNYTDLILESETSVEQLDGSILTTYRVREKTDTEKRLDAIENGQQTQDGAIEDMGAVVSAIAEQTEGGKA